MNKRGISPLIATVLLISFTIVISVVITAWIRTGLEGQLAVGSEKIASATACLSTKVDIPPAASKGVCKVSATDSKNIKIFIDNKGDNTVNEVSIKIIYTTGEAKTITRSDVASKFPLSTLNRAIVTTTDADALPDISSNIASIEIIPRVTEGYCKEGSMDTFTPLITGISNC